MIRTASLVHDFFRLRPKGMEIDVQHLPHAVEDVPPDVAEEAAMIFKTPVGESLQQRAFDVLKNAVAELYGHAECEDVFKFLSQYPVTPYTYEISGYVSRGERPDNGKVKQLHQEGFGATISFCAETISGDAHYIKQAGLTDEMQTYVIPVIDATPPTTGQAVELLRLLEDLRSSHVRTYIHCEAGKGRTGVMVACVRMAMMGWNAADAVTEAKNFGMWTPDQIAFIEDFGAKLVEQYDALQKGEPRPHPELGAYPRLRPGLTQPTRQQLTMTIEKAATQAKGMALK